MKIEDAIVEFLKSNGTFYASLLSQMHRIEDAKKTPTMSVQMKNGRINLFYNPAFIEPRSMKDTKAVLEHECMHIVMEHHLRAKDKDPEKWKVAADLAINQLLSHVPSDAITPEKIFGPDMHKMGIQLEQAAEYYYPLLDKSNEAKQQMQKMKAAGACGCGENFSDDKDDGSGKDTIKALDGVDQELAKEMIKQMVGEAVKSAKGQGHLPAGLESYIDELFKPPVISWRQLLRRFVSNSVKSGTRPSWKKPSRRYGVRQKGRVADRTVALTLVIDTSGSIDDGMLKTFTDEIVAIQKCYKSSITVLECDAEVQREYKLKRYEKLKRDVKGRGGTSFKPPFKYVREKNIRTDAVIYFTDLCGDFPSKKPRMPVLWAYYNGGWGGFGDRGPQVPFGTVVTLEKDKETHK